MSHHPEESLDRRFKNLVARLMVSASSFCYRTTPSFYWLLALFLTLVIAVSTLMDLDFASMDESTFDTIMKMRWNSPPAAQDIVILDIDEKSLAEMALKYGRWPWKREVFAQALAELEYGGAKSIMFTVLITDPDKEHEQSDAVLSFVASESYVTVYPLVRLPPKNDAFSKLKVCDLIPAGVMKCHTDKTIAAILPGLPGMRHDLGIMNHRLDEDGILRRWTLLWEEESWKMPTMVGGAIALAHVEPRVDRSQTYILNWRNKKNRYARVSFSDYLATLDGEERIPRDFFKGKHVIIGSSAPGLTVQNSTSVGLVDDVEILATALDDAINGTYLKEIPTWIISLTAVCFILGMAVLFIFGRSQKDLDSAFVAIEVGSVLLMAVAINYTTYFIDIMPLATYGLIYYSVARVHHEMAENVFMSSPDYLRSIVRNESLDSVGIIAFRDEDNRYIPGRRGMMKLQRNIESGRVFFCFEPFEEDRILEGINNASCLVVIAPADSQRDILEMLQTYLKKQGLEEYVTRIFRFPEAIRRNRDLAPKYVALQTLYVITQLPIDEGWLDG
jgi:CHASE2 domain-containing sensor protein